MYIYEEAVAELINRLKVIKNLYGNFALMS